MNFFQHLRYWLLLMEWKRRAHKRQRPHIRVGNVVDFFHQLNDFQVPYIVMRWFDEIPLTPKDEAARAQLDGDLDILADGASLLNVCRAVACHPGKMTIDLRSNSLLLGTDIKRFPYYPPVLCKELLEHRILTPGGYYRADDRHYLYSLAYHLVYQKGTRSGMPSGLDGVPPPLPTPHDPVGTLNALSAGLHETLPHPLTLLALHEWLKTHDWDMPFDLLPRWPVRNPVIDALYQREVRLLEAEMGDRTGLCVYLLREDAIKAGAATEILAAIREHYQLLDTVQLTPAQQQLVIRKTRGGDWTKRKQLRLYLPEIALICHTTAPVPRRGDILASEHDNPNIAFKHALRARLAEHFPDAVDFLHGSDNDLESFAYFKAIYGKDWKAKWEKLSQW